MSIGIQIVGKPYEDMSVFQASFNKEQVEPWFLDPKYKPNL